MLILESIEAWANKHPTINKKKTKFVEIFEKLQKKGITFCDQFEFYKDMNKYLKKRKKKQEKLKK